MGDHPDELNILEKLDHTLKQGLSMETDHFGFIFYDDLVRKSAKKREVLISAYPRSIASQNIEDIARRVTEIWDHPIENSRIRLIENTRKQYERLKLNIEY